MIPVRVNQYIRQYMILFQQQYNNDRYHFSPQVYSEYLPTIKFAR